VHLVLITEIAFSAQQQVQQCAGVSTHGIRRCGAGPAPGLGRGVPTHRVDQRRLALVRIRPAEVKSHVFRGTVSDLIVCFAYNEVALTREHSEHSAAHLSPWLHHEHRFHCHTTEIGSTAPPRASARINRRGGGVTIVAETNWCAALHMVGRWEQQPPGAGKNPRLRPQRDVGDKNEDDMTSGGTVIRAPAMGLQRPATGPGDAVQPQTMSAATLC
jgi:hypothetical protein